MFAAKNPQKTIFTPGRSKLNLNKPKECSPDFVCVGANMEEYCSVSCDDTSNDADFMYCMGCFLKTSKEKNRTCV